MSSSNKSWSVAGGRRNKRQSPQRPKQQQQQQQQQSSQQALSSATSSSTSSKSPSSSSSSTSNAAVDADPRTHARLSIPSVKRRMFVCNNGAVLRMLRSEKDVDLRLDAQNNVHVLGTADNVEQCVQLIEALLGMYIYF